MSDTEDRDRRDDVDASGSSVSEPSRRQLTMLQKLSVAGLILAVFLAFIWIGEGSRAPRQARKPDISLIPSVSALRSPPPVVVPPPPPSLPLPSSPIARQTGRQEITPAESPIFAFSGGGLGQQSPSSSSSPTRPAVPQLVSGLANGLVGAAPGGPSDGSGPPADSVAARLTPAVLRPAKAALLPHPDMLITRGTVIPCTLQTAINTELPGFVKCVLPQNIFGTTGNVVLLDRGTTVIGELRGGVSQGQDRVFILWDRAETPGHAVIDLSSPASDELGRGGVVGAVNTHFWERFGSAILLSVIEGSLQAASAKASDTGGGSGGTVVNSVQGNGEQVPETALRASIDIPPTITKNQGDSATIFVAKDLDFSDIYRLRYIGHGG